MHTMEVKPKQEDVPDIPIEEVENRVSDLLLHALPQGTTLSQYGRILTRWMEIYEQVLEGYNG